MGRKAEIPFVAVVNIRGDRLYHEHIAWDHTTLRQLGLMPDYLPFPYPVAEAPEAAAVEYRVPVLGRETADRLRNRKTVPSNEMFEYSVRVIFFVQIRSHQFHSPRHGYYSAFR